jgi:hypothetical protein
MTINLARVSAAVAGAALLGAALFAPPAAATGPAAVTLTDHGVQNRNCLTQELVHNIHGGGTLAVWAAPDGHVKAALVDADGLASDVVNVTTDTTKVASWGTCQQVAAAPNPTGGWLVVHSTRSDSTPTPLYGRLISKDGVPDPEALTLTSGTYLASLYAGGGNGNNQVSWSSAAERYLLTWTATIPAGNDLLADALAPKQVIGRFLDADGAGIGPDFLVTNVADMFVGPHAHARGADRWVVVGARVTGGTSNDWFARQLGAVTVSDAGTVSAPTAFGPVGLQGPDVAYNAQLNRFLVTFTEKPLATNEALLAVHALGGNGAPTGATVRLGFDFIHRVRVTSIGTTGYAIAYWDFPFIGDPRTFVIRVDAAGELIDGAPTVEIAGYIPSIVQECGTARPLMSWWNYNPTDVALQALDATGLTAPACLEVLGEGVDGSGPVPSGTPDSWVPSSGGAPQQPAGGGVWQQEDGTVVPLRVSSPRADQVRYETDGLRVTLTGDRGTTASGGLVATTDGEIVCEICLGLVPGSVVEVWMFSTPRLVAAHRMEDLPCQTFAIPLGAPLDGAGSVPVGVHTLQLALPTASGMQAVNVGVTVGGPVPARVPAGEGPAVPAGLLLAAGLVATAFGLRRQAVGAAC